MSAFKRANWHSGLTYLQKCPTCGTNVRYTDYDLDFRPWFADGFVSCPICMKPMRHRENYAVNRPTEMVANPHQRSFCTHCGSALSPNANFCANCGTKTNPDQK